MICSISNLLTHQNGRKQLKKGLLPADCAGDNDKHEQKKEKKKKKKKDIIQYSQEQPGTARQSPFPDEMKKKSQGRRGENALHPRLASPLRLHNPGPCCIDHQALNHQAWPHEKVIH
jgi:hypothetical protein